MPFTLWDHDGQSEMGKWGVQVSALDVWATDLLKCLVPNWASLTFFYDNSIPGLHLGHMCFTEAVPKLMAKTTIVLGI